MREKDNDENVLEFEIINKILNGTKEEIEEEMENIHPVDLLEELEQYEGNPNDILKKLPDYYVASLIGEMEDEDKYKMLSSFSQQREENIISEMASDDLADMLGEVDEDVKEKIISKMDHEQAEEVRSLLGYEEDTAGGLMAKEFIAIKEEMTIEESVEYLREKAPDSETPYYIYVLDNKGILKGVVSLRDIIVAERNTKIRDIMNENVLCVPVDMDQEEVGRLFEKYGYMVIPVVDEHHVMCGIITFDDIIDVLNEETTEDIYLLGGLSEGETIDSSPFYAIRSRLPWLMINLVTAAMAASVVGAFEGTISKIVALATFMPIVTGMGGNAGTQTLTLIVRGIALDELNEKNTKQVLIKELIVGIVNGICLGIVVGISAKLWVGKAVFGFIIGLAMVLNLIVAASAGYFVPVILKKLNIDPALASGVFVTTFTDVMGFFFFLGLATLFVEKLV